MDKSTKQNLERFQYYGDLKNIVEGIGKLHSKNGTVYDVSFEIAKRGEEKLLFNVISVETDFITAFSLANLEDLDRIEGVDKKNRRITVTGLLAKDSTIGTKTSSKVVLNGYAEQCEIGQMNIKAGNTIHFDLMNFLFLGNETRVEESEKGKKYSRSILQLEFSDFNCRIEHVEEHSIIEKLLKRQGGILNTSTLITEIIDQNDYENILEKVRKLCQLLSVARSTFINYGSYRIKDAGGNVIYELHGNPQTRPFHGNNLIADLPEDTVKFLNSAWKAYDYHKEIFDLRRFLYGYIETYMNSFIETRSLNIAVLVDNLASRWAIKENKNLFFEEEKFSEILSELKTRIGTLLENLFENLKSHYKHAMLSKIGDFNRRPLDWKLKGLRSSFNIPITDDEINQFKYIRDSLAHSSLFPDDVVKTASFFFMRHFLDRIILSILNYQGNYFDFESSTEKIFGTGEKN
tara:strand:+ start:18864 stop:20249 length:1386 start_codon:yes stop_codon:yes gene_type:complete